MAEPIYGKLYQFTNLAGNMNLPAHQYLLATNPSVMFATGVFSQAKWILPEIDEILGGKPLDYLFVSHMEADECGGLTLFKKKYPKITVLGTSLVSSELAGFGISARVIVCENLSTFKHGDLDITFFGFPVDVHGKDGLIAYDASSGILYSSDVIVKSGRSKIDLGDWNAEINAIDASRVPDEAKREKLKAELKGISPRFIATGHGSCINVDQ